MPDTEGEGEPLRTTLLVEDTLLLGEMVCSMEGVLPMVPVPNSLLDTVMVPDTVLSAEGVAGAEALERPEPEAPLLAVTEVEKVVDSVAVEDSVAVGDSVKEGLAEAQGEAEGEPEGEGEKEEEPVSDRLPGVEGVAEGEGVPLRVPASEAVPVWLGATLREAAAEAEADTLAVTEAVGVCVMEVQGEGDTLTVPEALSEKVAVGHMERVKVGEAEPQMVTLRLGLTVPERQAEALALMEGVGETEADTQPLRDASGAEGVDSSEPVTLTVEATEGEADTLGEGVPEGVPLGDLTAEAEDAADPVGEVEAEVVSERVAVGDCVKEGEAEGEGEEAALPVAPPVPVAAREPEDAAEAEGPSVTEPLGVSRALGEDTKEEVCTGDRVAVAQAVKELEVEADTVAEGLRTLLTVAPLLLEGRSVAEMEAVPVAQRVKVTDTLTLGVSEEPPVPLPHMEGEPELDTVAEVLTEPDTVRVAATLRVPGAVPDAVMVAEGLGDSVPLREGAREALLAGVAVDATLLLPDRLGDTEGEGLREGEAVGEGEAELRSEREGDWLAEKQPVEEADSELDGERVLSPGGEGVRAVEPVRLVLAECVLLMLGVMVMVGEAETVVVWQVVPEGDGAADSVGLCVSDREPV